MPDLISMTEGISFFVHVLPLVQKLKC